MTQQLKQLQLNKNGKVTEPIEVTIPVKIGIRKIQSKMNMIGKKRKNKINISLIINRIVRKKTMNIGEEKKMMSTGREKEKKMTPIFTGKMGDRVGKLMKLMML